VYIFLFNSFVKYANYARICFINKGAGVLFMFTLYNTQHRGAA